MNLRENVGQDWQSIDTLERTVELILLTDGEHTVHMMQPNPEASNHSAELRDLSSQLKTELQVEIYRVLKFWRRSAILESK